MKKIILSILILSSSISGFSQENSIEKTPTTSQDICKPWFWTSEDGTEDFEIDLTEVDGAIKGTHCSVVFNGKYLDCSYEDHSIDLRSVGLNIYEGTIQSGYSETTGKIKITYNKLNNTVHFQLLEEPSGVFYLPKDVVMK